MAATFSEGVALATWMELRRSLRSEGRGEKREGESALSIAKRRLGWDGNPSRAKVEAAVEAAITRLKETGGAP